ncbi:MAG TPA: proline--tRNA ligase [Chthoniobacterales bacterium]|nr:proline--tRNA ligase [Chthoniobacterales bacterium]
MNDTAKSAISPTRAEDFPEWYQQVVRAGDLAENSDVRGCMVIKPWGFGIWENIQKQLNAMFKATGHRNAYFPLFIPLSYMAKEAEHVEGFAKECAVVTHHRLEVTADGKLRPAPSAELTEPLVIRPTSETIIGATFSKWIQSYRDLPLLINQWANVVRWEMRPRVFLRTTEFLWQEGHTVHETKEEAEAETSQMLHIYRRFAEEFLAIPVYEGEKTASERFPGAITTLCIEAMMQDRKTVQSGTSHFLGQNFSKASNIRFLSRNGTQEFGWTTSWGASTRLVGEIIMTHADDDGAVLPPRIAPSHAVILPIVPKPEHRAAVWEAADKLSAELRQQRYAGESITVEVDRRDLGGGVKNWEWIKRGIPIRIELGPRDLEKGTVALLRRDRPAKEKAILPTTEVVQTIAGTLEEIQNILFSRAQAFRDQYTVRIDSKADFYDFFTPKNAEKPEIHGGLALTHWSGELEVEAQIKEELKVTIRCIPFSKELRGEPGKCPFSGKPSKGRVVFGKAY